MTFRPDFVRSLLRSLPAALFVRVRNSVEAGAAGRGVVSDGRITDAPTRDHFGAP